MIRSIVVVKVSYTRSASEAKASVRSMQWRRDDLGESGARILFDRWGEVTRADAYARLDRVEKESGKTYFYRIMLNPGEGHADLDEDGRQAWTAEVMKRLEVLGLNVRDWVGVDHPDQGEHDHIHVVAALSRTLQKRELADLRAYSREAYTRQKDLQRELGLYDPGPPPWDYLQREQEQDLALDQGQPQPWPPLRNGQEESLDWPDDFF